jgi:hypothetical protein
LNQRRLEYNVAYIITTCFNVVRFISQLCVTRPDKLCLENLFSKKVSKKRVELTIFVPVFTIYLSYRPTVDHLNCQPSSYCHPASGVKCREHLPYVLTDLNGNVKHGDKFLLFLLFVSVFIGIDAAWFSGMERRQFTVELFGVWRSEGS